jgi:Dolichyl-phosphate-mannose-protein mannosyltransferase
VRVRRVLPSLIIGLGVALRVAQYLRNRSLWGDEVAIALNLRLRTFGGVLRPLSYDQTMPLGLLVAMKSFASAFGYSELALRLPSLLIGCSVLILTWVLLSRLFEPRAVLALIATMAVSEPLIYYSTELKQYELDALITVLITWLATTTLSSTTNERWPWFIAVGAVAMFFSQPVILLLTSSGFAAGLHPRFRLSGVWRRYCVIAAAIWLMVFNFLAWFSYRFTMQSAFMRAFWSDAFINPTRINFRGRLSNALLVVLGTSHLVHIRGIILSCLFAVGVYAITTKLGKLITVLIAGPFLLLLFASALKQYPIAVRLLMFSVPLLLLIYASGLSVIADLAPESLRNLVFIMLCCVVILPTAFETVKATVHFNQREGTRDLVKTITARNQNGAVYLVFGKYKEWEYYAGDWDHRELLKQRIDLAYSCLQLAQVRFIEGDDQRPNVCVNLDFPAAGHQKLEEMVGSPPPPPKRGGEADEAWGEQEAARIRNVHAPSVWLFLPIYNENAINGFPKQRMLLEKLESHLEKSGCSLRENVSIGQSVGHNFYCPTF